MPIDGNWELGVYVINGQVMVAEKGPLQIGDLALLTEGDEIKLQAFGDLPVDIVLLGGEKIDYPLVFDGPFVMDSKENLAAYQNYKTGKMGSLDGIPF
ncbi:MAG: hypothetical protein IPQ04_10160 [Saprospiraceae bacterium]|nr:hypothetical protein [Saprospiraceae bacterium]